MTTLLIEEETGTYTARFRHPHNGYYAGDFSEAPVRPLTTTANPFDKETR